MAYVFLDESGDLGFSKKSSKWFLFTVALTSNPRLLEKAVRKVWKPLKKKHKKLGELHASHQEEITRKRMLKILSEIEDLKVFSVVLNKEKVYVDLQNQKHYLYNSTANVLLGMLHDNKEILKDDEPLHIYIDRKDTKKTVRENFIELLTESMKIKRTAQFSIVLDSSHDNKSLQAVDFISWAIYQKYEKGDEKYYKIIKDKIVGEKLQYYAVSVKK